MLTCKLVPFVNCIMLIFRHGKFTPDTTFRLQCTIVHRNVVCVDIAR